MFMRSGDIMVMSGSSRLLYHAVPCIVPASAPDGHPLPSRLDPRVDKHELSDWEVCATYLKTSRINMTVRQVLGQGQTFPVTHPHTPSEAEGSGKSSDEETRVAKKRKSESGYDLDS